MWASIPIYRAYTGAKLGLGAPRGCSQAVVANDHRRGGLKQEFTLSQFWKLEVSNQGVGRATVLPDVLGENLFLASSSFYAAGIA